MSRVLTLHIQVRVGVAQVRHQLWEVCCCPVYNTHHMTRIPLLVFSNTSSKNRRANSSVWALSNLSISSLVHMNYTCSTSCMCLYVDVPAQLICGEIKGLTPAARIQWSLSLKAVSRCLYSALPIRLSNNPNSNSTPLIIQEYLHSDFQHVEGCSQWLFLCRKLLKAFRRCVCPSINNTVGSSKPDKVRKVCSRYQSLLTTCTSRTTLDLVYGVENELLTIFEREQRRLWFLLLTFWTVNDVIIN